MQKHKKKIIAIAVLLLIVLVVFFYFYIPGSRIQGIADLHTATLVQVRRSTTTQIFAEDGMLLDHEFSHAEYELNPEQIEMLQAFILGNSFTRSTRSVITTPFPPSGILNRYDIWINFSDGTGPARQLFINIGGGGYFLIDQFNNSWIRINNRDWDEEILQILALS